MEISLLYKKTKKQNDFNIREYVTPTLHVDYKRQILERKWSDFKNRPRQQKFKPRFKHKPCFMDAHIKPLVPNPSPDRYKMKDGFGQDKGAKNYKSAQIIKNADTRLGRGTMFDQIRSASLKIPGVARYNVSREPFKNKHVNKRPEQPPRKFCHLDTTKTISDEVPGPGHHNPHKSVPHLRKNQTTPQFFIEKHQKLKKKMKSSIDSKLGPSTYKPVLNDTFEQFKLKKKGKDRSRWSHGKIDIREGERSKLKSPSPAQYHLLNQWSAQNPRERQTRLGKVKLFQRITQSTKTFSIYH